MIPAGSNAADPERGGARTEALADAARGRCLALVAATGARRVSVWLHHEQAGSVSLFVVVGSGDQEAEVSRRWSTMPVDSLERLAAELRAHPTDVDDASSAACRALGISSARTAPVIVLDQTVGLLVVEPVGIVGPGGLDQHAAALAGILSEAQAWCLLSQQQSKCDLLVELARSLEPETTGRAVERLCRRVAQEFGVSRACVFLAEEGRLVPAHAYRADGSVDLDGFAAFAAAPPPPIVERAFRERRTVVAEARSSEVADDWWIDRFGIASGVAVPIGTTENPSGVLALDDQQPLRFTPRVVALVELAAANFGLLYERAQLFDEHARDRRSAAAAQRLLREGSRARSLIEAVELAARIGCDAIGAEHAAAFLVDDRDRVDGIVTIGIDEPWGSEVRRRFDGVPTAVLRLADMVTDGRSPVVVADSANSDLVPTELVRGLPVRSYVVIPLMASLQVRGALVFATSRQARRWSRSDRHLVEQLQIECGLVLENAMLRESDADRAAELTWLALHDPLTELPNRALLVDRLSTALQATARSGGGVAVLFIDLCQFKQVNDRLGHQAGDLVLVEMGARFAGAVRPGDTVGRFAGDEFAVILPSATSAEAASVARRVCDVTERPVDVSGQGVVVGASIGVAMGGHTDTARDLFRRADAAMYRAKQAGGHGYAFAVDLEVPVRDRHVT
ncbi:MAG: diguanylate cyclase [Acidimicrobiales bacterium]|nr:diguanylate cyclase [Acidimicrobiales bacterium]